MSDIPEKAPSALGSLQEHGVVVLVLIFFTAIFALPRPPRFDVARRPSFWTVLTSPIELRPIKRLPLITGSLNDVFVDPDGAVVWTVGNDGLILRSSDGGRTWEQKPLRVDSSATVGTEAVDIGKVSPRVLERMGYRVLSRDLVAVHFTDLQNGWVLDRSGTLFLTHDGGGQWLRDAERRTANVADLGFVPGGLAWLIKENGQLEVRHRSGGPWQKVVAKDAANVIGAAFVDTSGDGWLVSGNVGRVTPGSFRAGRWRPASRALSLTGAVSVAALRADHQTHLWIADSSGLLRHFVGSADPSALEPSRLRLAHVAEVVTPKYGKFRSIAFDKQGARGWVVGDGGAIYATEDSGATWAPQSLNENMALQYAVRDDSTGAWIALRGDRELRQRADGGRSWTTVPEALQSRSRSLLNGPTTFLRGRTDSLAVSIPYPINGRLEIVQANYAVLVSRDNGASWSDPAPYRAWPPPWFLVVALGGIISWLVRLVWIVTFASRSTRDSSPTSSLLSRLRSLMSSSLTGGSRRKAKSKSGARTGESSNGDSDKSITDSGASDSPIESKKYDDLGHSRIAEGLSAFLQNRNTEPPLTIGLVGEWGMGKTSIMKLMDADLRRSNIQPVWFNAWHHQKDGHLFAALLQNIKDQATPSLRSWNGLRFRLDLLFHRGVWGWGLIGVSLGLAILVVPLVASAIRNPLDAYEKSVKGLVRADHAFAAVTARLDEIKRRATEEDQNSTTPQTATAPATAPAAAPADSASGQKPAVAGSPEPGKSGLPKTMDVLYRALATLAGLTLLVRKFSTAFKSFGINPAGMISGVSGVLGASAPRMRPGAQDSFRRQFGQVTRALKPIPLVIFVDDLDRCRPENVVEVLEAVSFLMSAGPCYVVLAMSTSYVKSAVGLAFKSVAAEVYTSRLRRPQVRRSRKTGHEQTSEVMPNGTVVLAPRAKDPNEVGSDEKATTNRLSKARRWRLDFASQYIEKLVNIEVPVPESDRERYIELLAEKAERASGLEPGEWLVRKMKEVWGIFWPVFVIMVLALGIGFGLSRGTSWLIGRIDGPEIALVDVSTPSPIANADQRLADKVVPQPQHGPQDSISSQASAVAKRPTTVSGARLTKEGGQTLKWVARIALLVVIGLIGFPLVGSLLSPRVRHVQPITDSPAFKIALKCWGPLVYFRHRSPRAAKRFRNRLRYIAMRGRDYPPSVSMLTRLLGSVRRGGDPVRAAKAVQDASVKIPEQNLAAIGALYELDPRFLKNPSWRDDVLLGKLPDGWVSEADSGADPIEREQEVKLVGDLLKLAVEEHQKTKWKEPVWPPEFKHLSWVLEVIEGKGLPKPDGSAIHAQEPETESENISLVRPLSGGADSLSV